MVHRLCVVGGDVRAGLLAPMLRSDGYMVDTLGLVSGDERRAEIDKADALLFAYPFSARAGKPPTLTGLTLYVEDVLSEARNGAVLLTGRGMERELQSKRFQGKGWRVCPYEGDEAFRRANAEISAEGAVHEAMKRTDRTLDGLSILVMGYGLFGRATVRKLLALGATVWVGVRREEQRLLAISDGARALPLSELHLIAGSVDMLMNTIPARVLDDAALAALPVSTPFLELASAPYAIDSAEAARRAPHYELLPALPARYAPKSAAEALRRATHRLLLGAGEDGLL